MLRSNMKLKFGAIINISLPILIGYSVKVEWNFKSPQKVLITSIR